MTALALIVLIPFLFAVVIATIAILTVRSAHRRAFNGVRPPRYGSPGGVHGLRRDGSGASPLDAFFADATYGNGGYAHPRHENHGPHGHHSHLHDFQYGDHGQGHGSYHAYHGSHDSGWSSSSHDGGSSSSYDSGSSSSSDSGSSSSDSGSSSSSSCD